MPHHRNYWTIATRDLRHVLAIELASREAANAFRQTSAIHHLRKWVVVMVSVDDDEHSYSSPELIDGPLHHPIAGSFGL